MVQRQASRGGHRIAALVVVLVCAVGAVASTSADAPARAAVAASSSNADLTTLVRPLAGSVGPGFVAVGAGLPFGMVTPGPVTTTAAGDHPANYVGYRYRDTSIRGFALTHFSGAGVHIGAELPMMPTTGAITSSDPRRFSSPFSHDDEVAQPGYYAATLTRYRTRAELTATTRTAVEQYTFPPTGRAHVLFDVGRDMDGDGLTSTWRVVDSRTVSGSVVAPEHGGITLWFTAQFNRRFIRHGTWLGSRLHRAGRAVDGPGAGGWVTFDTTTHRVVGVRVGISYVDAAGSARNLQREAPDGTAFASVRQRAHDLWNQRLHAIDVDGGTAGLRRTFTTALYHALLMPTTFDDADGRYLGFDGRVHTVAAGAHHYTDLSLWDTYRTQTPLLTLVAPDVAHDVGVSLLVDARQNGGVIPKWVRGNRDYGYMRGDSGTPTLATLVTDGALRGQMARRAYAAILKQANTGIGPREDLSVYRSKGFVPYDVNSHGGAVTLEYAVDDAAVAALARRYGTAYQLKNFTHRAESWRNLLHTGERFLRPRTSSGSWAKPTSRQGTKVWDPDLWDGWQEGTGWQYLWFVPQDVAGLRDALGAGVMLQRLDEFLGQPVQHQVEPVVPPVQRDRGRSGVYHVSNQYTVANETDLQAPWLYDWLGEPARTAHVVHAETEAFSSAPDGLPGNDDAGTLSADYVLSAIGLYQAQPGVAAWELSTPMFPSVVINGPTRPVLTITAPGAGPASEYAAAATLDGRALNRAWLTGDEARTGRTLAFTMSDSPTDWATDPTAAPPSLSR